MRKKGEKVELVEFSCLDDLYCKLEEVMCVDKKLDSNKGFYKIQNLMLMDDSHALVYLEEDFSVILVDFIYNGEKIKLSENTYSEIFLPHQEIQLMNDLGMVVLEDTEYAIEEIKYCIDRCGLQYIEIILN